MATLKSVIWRIFNQKPVDKTRAICALCKENVARGGSSIASFSTSNLWQHLLRSHKNEHEQLKEDEKSAKTSGRAKSETRPRHQQSTVSSLPLLLIAGAHSLVNDDQRAKQITKLITEMLATDDLPFNVVNNTGFRRLLQHLEPRYQIPD